MNFNIFFEKKFVYRSGGGEKPRGPEGPKNKPEEKKPTMEDLDKKIKAIDDHFNQRIGKLKKTKRLRRTTRQRIKKLKGTIKALKKKVSSIQDIRKRDRQEEMNKVNKELNSVMEKQGIKLPAKAVQKSPEGVKKAATMQNYKDKIKYAKDNLSKIKDPAKRKKMEAQIKFAEAQVIKIDGPQGKLIFGKDKAAKQDAITASYNRLDKAIKENGIAPPDKKLKATKTVKRGPREYTQTNDKQKRLIHKKGREIARHLAEFNRVGELKPYMREALNREINDLIRGLGKDPEDIGSNLSQHEYHKLPGGYSIALYKWKQKPNEKPNAMIYKGTKLVCYRYKNALHAPRGDESIDKGRSYAEMVKSFHLLPQMFYVEKGVMMIRNGKQNDFNKLTGDITKYCKRADWATTINGCDLQYTHSQGQLKIKPHGTDFHFAVRPPDTNLTIYKGGKQVDDNLVRNETGEEKVQRAKKIKEEAAKRKKAAEKIQKEQEKLRKAKMKMDKRVTSKYKRIVKFNEKNPYEFTVESKNKAQDKLIRKTSITKLLNLVSKGQRCNEIVMVKIKGPKGEKEGMYYPGQKTCYEMKNGRQTKKRLTFYKGDKMKVSFKKPNLEDYKKLNPRLKRKIKKPDLKKSPVDEFKVKAKPKAKPKGKEVKTEVTKKGEALPATGEEVRNLLGENSKLVKMNPNKPNEFRVTSSRLARLTIHQLFKGKDLFTKKAIKVTIAGKEGKREGIYYPGQQTVYEVKNGKQTDTRLKFQKGDAFAINMFKPGSKDLDAVRPEDKKYLSSTLEQQKLAGQILNAEREITAYIKAGGKAKNISKFKSFKNIMDNMKPATKKMCLKEAEGAGTQKEVIVSVLTTWLVNTSFKQTEPKLNALLKELKNNQKDIAR